MNVDKMRRASHRVTRRQVEKLVLAGRISAPLENGWCVELDADRGYNIVDASGNVMPYETALALWRLEVQGRGY